MLNGRDRPRPSAASDSRRGPDSHNGAGESMSRAEKFEDEKKRIIQSCYSKKDSDGTRMSRNEIPIGALQGGPRPF